MKKMQEWALGLIWVRADPTCTPTHKPPLQKAQMALCHPSARRVLRNNGGSAARCPLQTVHPTAHLHHELQALGGHVPLKDAPQQILKGVHGVLVQDLEVG